MDSLQADNFIAFVHQGYPLYCPICHRNIEIDSIEYKNHLQKHPSTCMYCKTIWKKKVRQWVDEKELSLMRSRLPSVSFNERSTLAFEVLERQQPISLEEKREQVLRIEIQSSSFSEARVKRTLKFQHHDWSEEQVETEYQRLIKLYKPS